MRHRNPYRVNDPHDIFEVGENSSHPELKDTKRLWIFGGYTFKSGTELQNFFRDEGLDPKNYWMTPQWEKDLAGRAIIRIYIKHRHQISREQAERARRLDQLTG